MKEIIDVKDKSFTLFIDNETIDAKIKSIAKDVTADYYDKNPIFIAILNGSFYFASDLFKQLDFPFEISFIKVSSYSKEVSSGNLINLIGLNEDINRRHVVIVEDIVDTGLTLHKLTNQLQYMNPLSVKTITLIFKEESLQYDTKPDYVCFYSENLFLVGYGLDYDQAGRNLKHIYKAIL